MQACPQCIGEDKVVCYTHLDTRHRHTGETSHVVSGEFAARASGLAICISQASAGFMLYGCDAHWSIVTDTWHASLAEAIAQAEHEYVGSSQTWVYFGREPADA